MHSVRAGSSKIILAALRGHLYNIVIIFQRYFGCYFIFSWAIFFNSFAFASAPIIKLNPYEPKSDSYYSKTQLRELLLLEKCPTEPIKRANFFLSNIYVANPATLCTEWLDVIPGINISSGSLNIDGNIVPTIIYSTNKFMLNTREQQLRIFIRIVGGPGGEIEPGINDVIYTNTLSDSDLLISLGYTGTQYGSRYPKADF